MDQKLDKREIDALVSQICSDIKKDNKLKRDKKISDYKKTKEFKDTLKDIEVANKILKKYKGNWYNNISQADVISWKIRDNTNVDSYEVRNKVILAQIDSKSLEELIQKVKSQL